MVGGRVRRRDQSEIRLASPLGHRGFDFIGAAQRGRHHFDRKLRSRSQRRSEPTGPSKERAASSFEDRGPLRDMQTRATAVGSTSESRLLPVGQRGARLPALPCDDKGKGAGDESFNQAAAVCFRAHHQRRGVRHHDRDPAPRIEVMPGYSAVLVLRCSAWVRWSFLPNQTIPASRSGAPYLTHARARISFH